MNTDLSFSNNTDYITFHYLLNNEKYKKQTENKILHEKTDSILSSKNKKFYRKRFYDLTKKLYKDKINIPHLQSLFNNYLTESIKYFQFLDISDSLQKEYNDLSLNKENIGGNLNYNITNDNNIIARKTHLKTGLDNFVIKKKLKKKKIKYPEKKIINLYDKQLKKKGWKKKKII